MSIKDEILAALAKSPAGFRRRELFNLCDSAGEPIEVSNALRELKNDGLIRVVEERVGNKGPVYALSSAPAEIESVQDQGDFGVSENGLVGDFYRVSPKERKEWCRSEIYRVEYEDVNGGIGGVSVESMTPSAQVDKPDQQANVDHFDVIMKSLVAIKTQVKPPRVVDDLELKLKCLNKLSVLFNPDVAEILNAIAVDLEATC